MKRGLFFSRRGALSRLGGTVSLSSLSARSRDENGAGDRSAASSAATKRTRRPARPSLYALRSMQLRSSKEPIKRLVSEASPAPSHMRGS